MGKSEIQAIETQYGGYRFRSRTEARWAVFFDHLRVEWRYEPEGYELPSGRRYLPDFLLPNVHLRSMSGEGLWVEVKGDLDLHSWDDKRPGELVREMGRPLALLCGPPQPIHEVPEGAHYQYARDMRGGDTVVWWDNQMCFMRCYGCGSVKFEYWNSSYMTCEACGENCEPRNSALLGAIRAAKGARFEHGEVGR